jgi:hypothetical protein
MNKRLWRFKRALFGLLVNVSNRLFGKELVHRSRLAGGLNRFWLKLAENFSLARRRQARYENEHPDSPWFVPEAINYIEKVLRPDFVGFEWGCGRSTIWFAKRVRHISSVEGRRSWFEEVKCKIAEEGLADKVTLSLKEVTSEHDFNVTEITRYAAAIDSIEDGTLDFIVVDGHFRDACLSHVGNKLRRGGLLIIDNSEVVAKGLLDSLKTPNSLSWNNGIWETTVIRRP